MWTDYAPPTPRVGCVRRTWTVAQRLHVGDVEWSWSGGDGRPAPGQTWSWGTPTLLGFADAWPGDGAAEVDLHLSPDAPSGLVDAALHDVVSSVSAGRLAVLDRERHLLDGLRRFGLRPDPGGAWDVHLWCDLTRPLAGRLPGFAPPAGFVVRPVRTDDPDDVTARVGVHRGAWAPARIARLLGLPGTDPAATSAFTSGTYDRVRAAPDYRPELDLVVEAPDGGLVANALGWLDAAAGCLLIEPVGTVPAYERRGLARVVCHGLLVAARDLGATQALVHARGDAAYPVPRRTYTGLGMRPVARTVPYAWGS